MTMNNERELLELAAKAVGIKCRWQARMGLQGQPITEHFVFDTGEHLPPAWNPIADDGDALRLAVSAKLRINIARDRTHVVYYAPAGADEVVELHGSEPAAATRLAIVKAAAALVS